MLRNGQNMWKVLPLTVLLNNNISILADQEFLLTLSSGELKAAHSSKDAMIDSRVHLLGDGVKVDSSHAARHLTDL